MYLGCVRDNSAVLPLFAAGECPCCRGAAGGGPRCLPNCHLLEIIEICVLKFVLHCTCMKCSSVFRTTVVKVIVDNAPPTRGRGCCRRSGAWLRLAGGGVVHAAVHVVGLRGQGSWCGRAARARTAFRHGAPWGSAPRPGLAPWAAAAASAVRGAVRRGCGRYSVWL